MTSISGMDGDVHQLLPHQSYQDLRVILSRAASACRTTILISALVASLFGGDVGRLAILPDAAVTISSSEPDAAIIDASLRAENKSGQWRSKCYLRFNLQWAQGGITEANLRLTISNLEGSELRRLRVWGLRDRTSGDGGNGWAEASQTWRTAIGNDVEGNGFRADSMQDLGTADIPEGSKSGDTVNLAPPGLLAFLAADSDGWVTLALSNETPVGANTIFNSHRIWYSAAKAPALLLTTGAAWSLDQTRDRTLIVRDRAQQTFRAWGTGVGGCHYDMLDEEQRRVASRVTWTDTRQTMIRLWCELDPITAGGGIDLSGFKAAYVDNGLIRHARAAGITQLMLTPGGHPVIPNAMLTADGVPEAVGQRALREDRVDDYGRLLARVVDQMDRELQVRIDLVAVANECINIIPTQWPRVIRSLRAELDKRGRTEVGIIGPEWPNNDDYAIKRTAAIQADPAAWKALRAVCNHSYSMPAARRFYEAFSRGSDGREYWINESNAGTAVDTGAHIVNDLNQGVSLWMYHEAVLGSLEDWANLVGYARHRPATDPDFIQLSQRYWYYRQMSTAVDPGCVIQPVWSTAEQDMPYLYGPAQMLATAGRNPDGSTAVALLNQHVQAIEVQLVVEALASQAVTSLAATSSGPGYNMEPRPAVALHHGVARLRLEPRELITLRSGHPPVQIAKPTATATFLRADAQTGAVWPGTYGKSGSWLPTDASQHRNTLADGSAIRLINAFPAIAALSPAAEREAGVPLTAAADAPRTRSYWHSFNGFAVAIDPAGTAAWQAALLLAPGAPGDRIAVVDAATGAILDTRELPERKQMVYLSWRVSGHVTFRLVPAPKPGDMAVLGIFTDP